MIDNFIVVSDYNWLPDNIEDSWVHKNFSNYLIYDKFHRFEENDRVVKQKNVGQNHYDMFDFIVTNYDNLPEIIVFCRAACIFPKDIGTPRRDLDGNVLSNGNCVMETFLELASKKVFTEIQDFTSEPWRFNGHANKVGPEGGYMEANNSWYFGKHPGKYYSNYDTFMDDMYDDYTHVDWIRFSPGGNYVIPKAHILKYNKAFYERVREIMSWDIIIGETHMVERATYTIFVDNLTPKHKYRPI